MLIKLYVIVLCLSLTWAHLCLWQPMQRGNFSLNPPGSHDCYRKIGPCGGFNSSTSTSRLTLEAGSIYNVSFQQHLNHYYPPNPGQMDISFAIGLDPPEENFRILTSFDDYNPMNHNTQTNFSIAIQLPKETCNDCVLRVRYLTNNPDEEDHGRTFYQCSDIKLVESSQQIHQQLILNKIQSIDRQNDSHDCCAPASFQTMFIHWMPDISSSSSGMIYYDQPSQQMRISMMVMGTEYNMWMNFTSGKQYYHDVNNNSCHLFGLDLWNDWCYGNTYNQSEDFFIADASCYSGAFDYCNRWKNGDFLFDATSVGCYPSALNRLSNGERTVYYNQKNGSFTPDIFKPDPICLTHPIIMTH